MPVTLFFRPIENLNVHDVNSILGWPESLTVEFKEALSTKGGAVHPWNTGGKLDDRARDSLFKEVIALANTSGGHVILGIEESSSQPPVAHAVAPIPRCIKLAECLEHAAQEIDPPIPLLLVRGIETSADTGIVLFRVPASRSAPHRGLDKECFVRRGTSSVPVGMREIQDMTIAVGRRSERIDTRLAQASSDFLEWLNRPRNTGDTRRCGFHLAAYPTSPSIDLGRIDALQVPLPQGWFKGRLGPTELNLCALRPPHHIRPIIRGIRCTEGSGSDTTYLTVCADGLVDFGFQIEERDDAMSLSCDWILGHACNLLNAIEWVRKRAAQPDCEYIIEMQISKSDVFRDPIHLHGLGGHAPHIGLIPALNPVRFPRLSFGPIAEANQLLNVLLGDLWNAAEQQAPNPNELRMQCFA